MSKPRALVVGRSDLASGVDCAAVLADVSAIGAVEHVADLTEAEHHLADGSHRLELIVLCESRRGEFSAPAIERVRAAAPLVRVWRVLGSWHEGEPRSGRPPVGCVSSYWHQWAARAGRTLPAAHGAGALSLPLTATAEERLLAESVEPIEQSTGTVVVCASRFESAAALADVCRLGGYDAVIASEGAVAPRPDATSAVAMIWDTTPACMGDRSKVAQFHLALGDVPIIAVVGFPRAEDVRRAREAGIEAVVSKPYLLRDLLWQVRSATDRR